MRDLCVTRLLHRPAARADTAAMSKRDKKSEKKKSEKKGGATEEGASKHKAPAAKTPKAAKAPKAAKVPKAAKPDAAVSPLLADLLGVISERTATGYALAEPWATLFAGIVAARHGHDVAKVHEALREAVASVSAPASK
jgi:hypothetical protein